MATGGTPQEALRAEDRVSAALLRVGLALALVAELTSELEAAKEELCRELREAKGHDH